MAGFYGKIDTFAFDRQRFGTNLQEAGKEAIRTAAQKWLIACLRRIPIRTGFLMGSFTPLENLVGVVNKGALGGFIERSRNPLVTRERRIADLAKRIKGLEAEIDRRERSGGAVESGIESIVKRGRRKIEKNEFEGLTVDQKRNERIKRIATVQTDRIQKQINKLNARLQQELAGRGAGAKVAFALEQIRQKRAKMGKYFNKAYNPTLKRERARFMHDYHEVETITERIEKAQHSQKERLEALRKGKKLAADQIIREKIISIQKRMGLYRAGVRVFAFKEYYVHTDKSRTLKTPRSGVRFATPEDEIFTQYGSEDRPKDDVLAGLLKTVQQQKASLERFLESQTTTSIQGLSGFNVNVSTGSSDIARDIQREMIGNANKQLRDTKTFFAFKFQVDIQYLDVNDITGKIRGAPWYAYAAGNAAFAESLRSNNTWMSKFNDVTSYLLNRTLTFNGQSQSEVKNMFRGTF